jgi:hypothetical protein
LRRRREGTGTFSTSEAALTRARSSFARRAVMTRRSLGVGPGSSVRSTTMRSVTKRRRPCPSKSITVW